MKIAFFTYSFPPTRVSGSSFYALKFTSSLAELGHDVTVFTLKKNCDHTSSSINFEPVNFLGWDNFGFPLFALKSIRSLQGFDIVHAQGGGRFLSSRVDVETFHHLPQNFSELVHALPSLASAMRSRAIFSVSERTRDELYSLGFNKSKIHVIHNGIDEDFVRAIRERKKSSNIGSYPSRTILCVCSQLTKRKNLSLALRTVASLDIRSIGCTLVIVAPSDAKSRVYEIASQLHIEKKVKYFSGISVMDLAQLYLESKVVVIPSIQEGFSLPMLEATAAGVPFVSYDIGISSYLTREGFGRICHSEREFFDATADLLLADKSNNGKGLDFVSNNFTWKKCALEASEVYKKICNINLG